MGIRSSVLCLGMLAGCGGGDGGDDAPFEEHVQYGVDPALQGFDRDTSLDGMPILTFYAGVSTCFISGDVRLLLVSVPPGTEPGTTLEIGTHESPIDSLRAGQAHASVLEGGLAHFPSGGTVTLRDATETRVTAVVRAAFEAGPFDVEIDATPCDLN